MFLAGMYMEIIKDLSRLHIPVSAEEWFAAVGKCDNSNGWWCFGGDNFRLLGSVDNTAGYSRALAMPPPSGFLLLGSDF